MNAQEFVAKWKQSELRERASSQEHFIDICNLLNQETPAKADPKGDHFTFEYGTKKQSGTKGWADVWKKNHFAWEYKGKHKDLDKAYKQLLQYREALQNPPLLIVSDIESIVIHTNFNNTVKQITTFALDDLLKPQNLTKLKQVFTNPNVFRIAKTPEQVTEEAATEFAKLADQLRKWGDPQENIAHFLIRLLFCLFAEDSDLLPKMIFSQLVSETKREYKAFANQLSKLFEAMSKGGFFGANRIPHFDGGLFEDHTVLELDSEGIQTLLRLSYLDWSSIEPAILGTLFERSLDPSKRAQIGAHYTKKSDIDLVIEPILIEPLQEKWQSIKFEAIAIAQTLEHTKETSKRVQLEKNILKLLKDFSTELANVTILDPACGSGNFLYVALRRLLDLEKDVIMTAGTYTGQTFFPQVSPDQLFGIEINPYAFELAQATIWIGYIQWLTENGFGTSAEPILKPLKNFKRMDAILSPPPHNKPFSPIWPKTDVIVGNPPFLGSRRMRPSLGDEYCDALVATYDGRMHGMPDLVCYWFEKANEMISKMETKRAGLLATQAIRGGNNRQVLDRIIDKNEIYFAWSDREWLLDGAVVHVSIVGFGAKGNNEKRLNGHIVKKINSSLSSKVDISAARKLVENKNIAFQGTVQRGKFNIPMKLALEMLSDESNPNGRPNMDVIKMRRNAKDIVGVLSDDYVIDFGVSMTEADASQYAMPFEYLRKNVFPERQEAKQKEAREKWWLFWNPRKNMREKLGGLSRYIATPRVGKHRIFQWLSSDILPDNALVVFAREDDYFFGVLHSRIHEIWARNTGTQLRDAESGFRYTLTTVFEPFPMPYPPGAEEKSDTKINSISAAAKELYDKRENWQKSPEVKKNTPEKSLTTLYNENPSWLKIAHKKIDKAVFAAYGIPDSADEEKILSTLLDLNLSREA